MGVVLPAVSSGDDYAPGSEASTFRFGLFILSTFNLQKRYIGLPRGSDPPVVVKRPRHKKLQSSSLSTYRYVRETRSSKAPGSTVSRGMPEVRLHRSAKVTVGEGRAALSAPSHKSNVAKKGPHPHRRQAWSPRGLSRSLVIY